MRVIRIASLIALCAALFVPNVTFGRQQVQGVAHAEDTVSREVRHELVMLPRYSVFDILQYTVNGGHVTLNGAVTDPTLKSDAE